MFVPAVSRVLGEDLLAVVLGDSRQTETDDVEGGGLIEDVGFGAVLESGT